MVWRGLEPRGSGRDRHVLLLRFGHEFRHELAATATDELEPLRVRQRDQGGQVAPAGEVEEHHGEVVARLPADQYDVVVGEGQGVERVAVVVAELDAQVGPRSRHGEQEVVERRGDSALAVAARPVPQDRVGPYGVGG